MGVPLRDTLKCPQSTDRTSSARAEPKNQAARSSGTRATRAAPGTVLMTSKPSTAPGRAMSGAGQAAPESRHALDVRGVGEHVERGDLAQAVALGREVLHVARQRGGIA